MPLSNIFASPLFFYVIIFVIFYFVLIIPQRRREKQFRELISSLKEGDTIVTIGGVIGKITHIQDDEISIESGLERTKLKVARWAVKSIEQPVAEAK